MKYTANPVIVDAYPITGISPKDERGGLAAMFDNGEKSGGVQAITPEMMARMHPAIGDYIVVQQDGYIYLNPKDVFERKYSPVV